MPHYADHLLPIWEALPVDLRGEWWAAPRVTALLRERGISPRTGRLSPRAQRLLVVAGYGDMVRHRGQRYVLVEHGAGQAYDVDDDPGWSGGAGRDEVVLFVCPNEVSAERNRRAYPATPAIVVGSPRVDMLRTVERRPDAVVLSFHWHGTGKAPEAGWALPHYEAALGEVVANLRADGIEICGHGHPRAQNYFAALWRRLGIEHLRRFDDVVRRASVYVCDNSSTMYEAAACGIPIVVLNAPWYRRDVDLWPRFWRCADVGVQVDGPSELPSAVRAALANPPEVAARRATCVAEVYPMLDGMAAQRAAEAIARAVCEVVG